MTLDEDIHKHYDPMEYKQELQCFKKNCHSGYEILRVLLDECYNGDTETREYYLGKFLKAYDNFEEYMSPKLRDMYHNMYIGARREYYRRLRDET